MRIIIYDGMLKSSDYNGCGRYNLLKLLSQTPAGLSGLEAGHKCARFYPPRLFSVFSVPLCETCRRDALKLQPSIRYNQEVFKQQF